MGYLQDVINASSATKAVDNVITPAVAEMNAVTGRAGIDPLGNTNDYLNTYQSIQWVYACAYQIQVNIAQLKLKFYKGEGDDKKEIIGNRNLSIFDKPDPFNTRFMFWMFSIGYLELTGELFWYMPRENENQIPETIIPLRPDRMKIVPHPTEYISGYVYEIDGLQIPLQKHEVYYMRYFNPLHDYRGQSPLMAAKSDVILELNSVNWRKDFFKDGMKPTGLLSLPGAIDNPQFKKLKKQFKDQYEGKQKTLILEQGVKWEAISLPPKDVEFIKQSEMTKAAILAVYGVPPIMVMDLTDSSVLQNTDIQVQIFWENTLVPKMRMFLEEFNTEVLPIFGVEDGTYAEFDTSEVTALQENQEQKELRYDKGIKTGAITPNEQRIDIFGKEASTDPAMDMFYMPINMISVGSDITAQEQRQLMLKQAKIDEEEKRLRLWKIFIARIVPIARRFEPELTKIFKAMEKEVLENWMSQKMLPEVISKIEFGIDELFNAEKWVQAFKDAGEPFLAEAMEKGGASLLKDLGLTMDFNMNDPFVIDTIKTRLKEYSVEVVGTTQKKIVEQINAGMAENETIEMIADRLRHTFSVAEAARAPRIARTEVSASFNAGNLEGMNQSGIVDEHMWLSSRDDDVRRQHEKLDGKVVKRNEPFPGYTDGSSPNYPSSINERCTTIPVRKELQ